MRNFISALAVAMTACLAAAAAAAAGDPGPIQVSGQSATTSQQAVAGSSATQVAPSNTNISIRVLSPGNDGAVSQTNSADSSAAAGNQASTTQSADQAAAGSGIQTSQQSAGTDQLALGLSAATQLYPSNVNVPIRVLSPGSDGSVTQSNTAGSRADAGNASTTTQTGTQDQTGSSCGCDSSATPIQTADQSASTDQGAAALSDATQIDPSNTAVSVRVLSPGDGGSVSQTNSAASSATAGNDATTTQDGSQSQTAGTCGCSGDAIQQAKQSAATDQGAAALSAASQDDPSNDASPVRVWSPGSDGSVTQSNSADSSAKAGNRASTGQDGTQSEAGGGLQIQALGQQATTGQEALAASLAAQLDPSNEASPVRVHSPGGGGSVSQSNGAASSAAAGNDARTTEAGSQTIAGTSCGCGQLPIQVAGQWAGTEQIARALSAALQVNPSNDSAPVAVWSPSVGGSLVQSNGAGSRSDAGNRAGAAQGVSQAA
jgi:hypothetical protein